MGASLSDPVPSVALCANLAGFFQQTVETVRQRRGYEATAAADAYLAGLLASQALPQEGPGMLDRPLVLVLADTLQKAGPERFEGLRGIGDRVLYTLGFFADYLASRGLHTEYAAALGAQAYGAASRMVNVHDQRDPGVLGELSTNFPLFVTLLHDVADTLSVDAARSHRALVELYQRWLRTGSPALAEALTGRGLLPRRSDGMLH